MLRRVVGAVLVLGALAGCGSSTAPRAQPPATTVDVSATTNPPLNVTGRTSVPDAGAASTAFCNQIRAFADQVLKLTAAIGNAANLRTVLAAIVSALDQAAAVAPADIKADMTTLAHAYADIVAGLDKVGYDFSKLPSSVQGELASPAVQAASTHLSTYSGNVCKNS